MASCCRCQSGPAGSLLLLVVVGCVVAMVSAFSTLPYANHQRLTCHRSELSMGMMGRVGRRRRGFPFARKRDLRIGKSGMVSTTPVMVKPRPMLTVSADTGEFRNVQPPSRRYQAKAKRGSKWNVFKQSVYSAADGVASIPKMFRRKEKEPLRPIQGYGDTIEQVVRPYSPSVEESPGQRLMQQLESNPRAFAESTLAAQEKSTWNSVKSGVYGTLDGLSGFFAKEEKPAKPPIASFKTIAQESISSSATVKKAVPDLISENPFQKLRAERAIRNWENKQRGLDKEEFGAELKETVYGVIDAIGSVFEAIASIPDVALETVNSAQQFATLSVDFVASIPKKFNEFVQGIQSLANSVQQGVTDTQNNIRNGVKITKAVVKDVQALPQTVSRSVEDTKRSIIETQKGLEDAVHNVKVLVGAEKPKPKPPKRPPPITSKDVAWRVAGGVATGSAKAAWFVGKLGIKGAQFLISKASKTEAVKGVADKIATTAPSILKQEQAELDREVEQAMQLAADALRMADDDKTSTSELEGAVKRAREAALKATKEAVEIKQKLQEEMTEKEESERSTNLK